VEIVEEEGTVLGINVGHPIITLKPMGFYMRGGEVTLPKLLWNCNGVMVLLTSFVA